MRLNNKVILLLSPQPWSPILVSKHHYAIELAKRGNTIYFLEPPSSKINGQAIRKSEYDNIFIISYKANFPIKLRFHFLYLFKVLMKNRLLNIVKAYKIKPDIVWSFETNLYLDLKWIESKLHIFHPVDKMESAFQVEIGNSADIIFSVANNILNLFEKCKIPKYFISHGLSELYTNYSVKKLENNPIKFAYVGNLLVRGVDNDLIIEIVNQYPEIQFSFYGPYLNNNHSENNLSSFVKTLLSADNAKLHGITHPKILKDKLNEYDGFLICYDLNEDLNQCSNSHKILEYLSTGKVVVSTIIGEYKKLNMLTMCNKEDNSDYIEIFSDVVQNLDKYNSIENQTLRIDFANNNTYTKQIDKIESILTEHFQ